MSKAGSAFRFGAEGTPAFFHPRADGCQELLYRTRAAGKGRCPVLWSHREVRWVLSSTFKE